MTAELRRGLLLAILGLVGGLGVVAILAGTGILTTRQFLTSTPTAPAPNRPEATPQGPGPQAALPAPSPSQPAPAPAGAPAPAVPSPAPREPQAPAAPPAPSFDVIRVEPDGSSVIAGRGAPGTTVELLRGGESFARVLADPSGLFAFVPPPLPPGTSEISLRSTAPENQRVTSRDSVLVVIAPGRDAKPLVALTSPGKPTVVLSRPESAAEVAANQGASPPPAAGPAARPGEVAGGSAAGPAGAPPAPVPAGSPNAARPTQTAKAPPPAAQPVKVVSVEAEEGGRLYVSAQATPGATVRLYLNETLVAPGSAGADGRVTFAIGRGMKAGDYRVRLDQVDPVSGEVRTRSEVPFAFPPALAREAPPARVATASPPSAPQASVPPASATPPQIPSTVLDRAPGVSTPVARPPSTPPGGAGRPPVAAPGTAAAPGAAALLAPPTAVVTPLPPAGLAASTEPPRTDREAAASSPPAGGAPRPVSETAAAPAGAPGPVAAAPAGRPLEPGTVYVAQLNTATVTRGDNLWNISRRTYGAGVRYTVIYDANQGQIRNPSLIYPGQIFVLPADAAARRAEGSR